MKKNKRLIIALIATVLLGIYLNKDHKDHKTVFEKEVARLEVELDSLKMEVLDLHRYNYIQTVFITTSFKIFNEHGARSIHRSIVVDNMTRLRHLLKRDVLKEDSIINKYIN